MLVGNYNKTVAVHSTVDEKAMHVRLADESMHRTIDTSKSYLNISAILAAAELSGADAIHPGMDFFRKCKIC